MKKAVLRMMSDAGSQTDKTFLKGGVVLTLYLITRRLRSLSLGAEFKAEYPQENK
jgi:hypothetical protein